MSKLAHSNQKTMDQIERRIREDDERYWTYRSSTPTPIFSELPEGCFNGDEKGWTSLSPGMRREILRSFNSAKEAI